MFERSTEIAELIQALVKAQTAMKNPQFDSQNPHFRTRYASLKSVRDAVTPVLAEQGLVVTQLVGTEGQNVCCETVLWHSSGQYLASSLQLPATKPDAQGYGSAITYARRYALMALCNVAGEDDDDAETGQDHVRQSPTSSKVHTAQSNGGTTSPSAWRDTLEAHKDNPLLNEGLRSKVKLALNPASQTTDIRGLALAGTVLDVLGAVSKQ